MRAKKKRLFLALSPLPLRQKTYRFKCLPAKPIVALIWIPKKILQRPEFTVQIVVNLNFSLLIGSPSYVIIYHVVVITTKLRYIFQIELGHNIESGPLRKWEEFGQKEQDATTEDGIL